MNTDGTGFHTCKECHKTESLWNNTTTDHREGEQLEDRRSVGASSCNCGDGTDQRVQSLMFMMMMIMTMMMMKNPLTPAGIETATFRFVAQHLNHCPTAVYECVIFLAFPQQKWIRECASVLRLYVNCRFYWVPVWYWTTIVTKIFIRDSETLGRYQKLG